MIPITQDEFQALEEHKLLDHSRANHNYTIVNRQKKSKRKKYYVAETKPVMQFIKKLRGADNVAGKARKS